MTPSFNAGICPEYLYLHWPFCKNKCHYCDFVAFEKHEGFERQYHEALCNEIQAFVQERKATLGATPIKTMFMGGGTPSLYPLPLMKELFDMLARDFNLSQLQECSIEVNPGALTPEHFNAWRAMGINRLSIGVQVLDDKVLYDLNRRQTAQQAAETIEMASAVFDNLSVDLILGLPGVAEEVWQKTLNTVVSWPIKHVSVYFLTVHEQTPLYFRIMRGELKIKPDEQTVKTYQETVAFLERHGFNQYEISNFAKPGFESAHNRAYWDRKVYKGFGIGAASFDGSHRLVNEKSLVKYTDHWVHGKVDDLYVGKGAPFVETLTAEQSYIELLMLGLRQKKGIELSRVLALRDASQHEELRIKIEKMVTQGYMKQHDGIISLTLKGMILENSVVSELF